MSIARGQPSIGMSTLPPLVPTLPTFVIDPATHLAYLEERLQNIEVLVERKADSGSLRSLIAISNEAILIQAKNIALVGAVTIADIIADQNGSASGVVHPSITRIVGDKIQTGTIFSNNFDASNGSKFDLNNGTLMMGGYAAPKFLYEDGDLTISGTLEAGSIITNSVTVDGVTIGTIKDNAETGSTHAGSTGNVHSVTFAQITGDLDDIADGSTYFKSTATQNTGGTRAANALDSSFDYIRSISTQKIVVSGSNPTNGTVIDSSGLRGYSGGSLSVNISTAGASTWSKDIATSGSIYANGSTSDPIGSQFGVIVVNASTTSVSGLRATSTTNSSAISAINSSGGVAISAVKESGSTGSTAAISAVSGQSGNPCISLFHTAGGNALVFSSPKISGDVNFLDDVDIDLTLVVGGTATFNNDVVIQGNSTLNVDRSVYFGTDAAGGDSSVVIGSGSGGSGQNTLVFIEGTAGLQTANQWLLYGQLDSGQSKTTLGIVAEATVESGTGAFAGINQLPIYINGTRWKWPLEAY